MQEKVSQAPPPVIKIFEGKPPPTSWVEENIVKFYQTQAQVDLLTDVLLYVQSLQSQQLDKERAKGLQLKTSFLELSEKGTAEDIGNRSVFNAGQTYLKTQIESLYNLILIVQQGNSKLGPEFEPLLNQLKQMGEAFPHLSAQQMQTLNQMMEQALAGGKQLPLPYQRFFWNAQLKMLQNLMNENGSNIKDFRNETKELHARSEMLTTTDQLSQEILKTLQAKPLTKDQALQLIENLQDLANKNLMMNAAQSPALSSFFQKLDEFTTDKGQKFSQIVADVLVNHKISAFLKSNPSATPEQVAAFSKQFLKESNLQNSPLPFMKNLGDEIEEIVNKKGFPASKGFMDIDFATKEGNTLQSNENLPLDILVGYSPNQTDLTAVEESSKHLNSVTSVEMQDNATKIEGFGNTVNTLSEMQNHLGRAALWSVGQSLMVGTPPKGAAREDVAATSKVSIAAPAPSKGADAAPPTDQSLPSQFQHAILDYYMPRQQAYLEDLAMVLYLDNNGAMFGNKLLEDMLGFGGAANTFSFGNTLHPTGSGIAGDYIGNWQDAANQLKAEQAQCAQAINQVTNSIQDIDAQVQSISKQLENPKLTAQQRKILTDQQNSLMQQEANLKVLYDPATKTGQLADLSKALNAIAIGPPSNPTELNDFHVYNANPPPTDAPAGWEDALKQAERIAINGNPDNGNLVPPQPIGGLVNAYTQAQTFQQTYSDQSQNQQMMLQMRMTEIQQEWTVVSTALQLLNQMYMTIAQGIYQ